MNMEAQATAIPKSEGEEKQAKFEANVARAADIQKEITEAAASGDFAKIAELSAEGQQLKGANENTVATDFEAAKVENAEFDAEKARQKAETKQKEAEVLAAQAEQARLDAEQAAADQAAAEKLAEEIKNGGGEKFLYKQADGEWTKEKPIEERLEAPKTEMFEKYGEQMRSAAKELADVTKEMRVYIEKARDESLDIEERQKAEDAGKSLRERINHLADAAVAGIGVMKLSSSYGGSLGTYSEMVARRDAILDKYRETAMSDPVTVMYLAEAGELGDSNSYMEGTGIGKIDIKLRSNPEYVAKLIDVFPANRAGAIWPHVEGEARSKDLFIAAILKNPLNYQFGSEEMKMDQDVQKAVQKAVL